MEGPGHDRSKRRKHAGEGDGGVDAGGATSGVAVAQKFLGETPLSAVANKHQKLVMLEHNDTVSKALQVLRSTLKFISTVCKPG